MAVTHTEEFRREAVRIALEQRFVTDPRGGRVGDWQINIGTLGFAVTGLLSVSALAAGRLVRENERLRLENRVLREKREILKKPRSFSRAKRHEVRPRP